MNFIQNMLLSMIRKQDPKAAKALEQCMKQGMTPQQTLEAAEQAGLVTDADFDRAKANVKGINRKFGTSLNQSDLDRMKKK